MDGLQANQELCVTEVCCRLCWICDQIGKLVTQTIENPDEILRLQFSDGSEIEVSLKEDDQIGPEAAALLLEDEAWFVW